MKLVASFALLGCLASAAPAGAQEVIYSSPVTTYYAPSVPVTTYYAPSVPYTTYYAPSAPVATYYAPSVTSYYAPAAVYPAPYYYMSPRAARRWYRGYGW